MSIQRQFLMLALTVAAPCVAQTDEICSVVGGASIIAQDDRNAFLGKVTSRYDLDSIFNEYGDFGGPYSTNSIWNEYGDFGSEYAPHSPQNPYASEPPLLVKQGRVLGYLTTNEVISGGISPSLLKALCAEVL